MSNLPYISKSEFRSMLSHQYEAIKEFGWSDLISLIGLENHIPCQAGVLILKNKDKEIIYISATNDMPRRLGELLYKSDGRFDDTAYVQFTLEREKIMRFGKKSDFKNLLKFFEVGEENLVNVLEDNDPRIIEQDKELAEYMEQQRRYFL
ncbi:hypothetical protein ACFRAM_01415 [Paenibacillus sp. NPDC056722]|uniref:hypothetical protein n=1 Tax=Paenibacillus sp. NPDC056722 TaxID=3345924 RepID=UPI0036B53C7D